MLNFFNFLTGNREEFTMENRAFNFLCITTFFLLFSFTLYDIYYCHFYLVFLMALMLIVLVIVFYFSRFKKKYKISTIVYAISSYGVLIVNYFYNCGINGPTLILFFVTSQFLISSGKPRNTFYWLFFHISVALVLLLFEYKYPRLIQVSYSTNANRFLDMGLTYVASIVFVFCIIHYLRMLLREEKALLVKRAKESELQNKKITEQNSQLAILDMEKTKLFSIISHDLINPFNALKSYIQLINDDSTSIEEKKYIISELELQAKSTHSLLQNLLFWAKSQMNGLKINKVITPFIELADEVSGNFKTLANQKNISILIDVNPDLKVFADRDLTLIILRNIINNAIKFTNVGGTIQILAEDKGTEIEIRISDNGIGISEEKQKDIFTLKAKSTYGTENEKGIGLGLLLCKEFAEMQGGRIYFESTPKVGTTVFVILPTLPKN